MRVTVNGGDEFKNVGNILPLRGTGVFKTFLNSNDVSGLESSMGQWDLLLEGDESAFKFWF